MKKVFLVCLVLTGSLFARSANVSDYALPCAMKASSMDLRGDLGKVATVCKECLYDMPMLNIDKTDKVMLEGTQQCLTKYIEMRNSQK